jgi:hypothetical protein
MVKEQRELWGVLGQLLGASPLLKTRQDCRRHEGNKECGNSGDGRPEYKGEQPGWAKR